MPLEINNPNPDPVSDLVANFENNLSFYIRINTGSSILYANDNFIISHITTKTFLIGLIRPYGMVIWRILLMLFSGIYQKYGETEKIGEIHSQA
jgi:hypothetical protein